jgi:hypothetical protein
MNKIRKTAVLASLLTAMGFGLAGCEWKSPSDNETWSDSYNWINFSGVYKNPNGGSVVTDFTTVVTTNTSGGAVIPGPGGTIATGNGGSLYSGTLARNVVPGSLKITAGGVVFSDDGAGTLVPSSDLGTISTISYGSGAWGIDLGGIIIPSGEKITASYSVYQTSSGSTTGGGKTTKNHGTTGVSIISLTALQEGNLLTLIDSDGKYYTGRMGSVRSASGDMGTAPRRGDVVIAQFTCSGNSYAGMAVEIVGLFQGTITVTGGADTFVMSARSIQGQWIEKSTTGKVGDVVGVATDAAINWTDTGTTP